MDFIKQQPQVLSKVIQLDTYMVNHKGYIAGGCFKNIFLCTKLKDVDIFFNNQNDFSEALAHFKGHPDYVFSYENPNAVSYKNKVTNVRVELVRRIFLPVEEMLQVFDFTITKMAYSREVNNECESFIITHHKNFFQDLVCRKLVLGETIQFPISTFERSFRYTKYGYGLCKESKINLINAMKLSNDTPSDSLYFGLD